MLLLFDCYWSLLKESKQETYVWNFEFLSLSDPKWSFKPFACPFIWCPALSSLKVWVPKHSFGFDLSKFWTSRSISEVFWITISFVSKLKLCSIVPSSLKIINDAWKRMSNSLFQVQKIKIMLSVFTTDSNVKYFFQIHILGIDTFIPVKWIIW